MRHSNTNLVRSSYQRNRLRALFDSRRGSRDGVVGVATRWARRTEFDARFGISSVVGRAPAKHSAIVCGSSASEACTVALWRTVSPPVRGRHSMNAVTLCLIGNAAPGGPGKGLAHGRRSIETTAGLQSFSLLNEKEKVGCSLSTAS